MIKHKIFGILLISVYSLLAGAQAPCNIQPRYFDDQYQRIVTQHVLLYGAVRAEMDEPVRFYGVNGAAHNPYELHNNIPDLRLQQQVVMNQPYQPKKIKQKNNKQYCNQNNNRIDRQKHAQINKYVNQPKQRNQKRFNESRR